MTVTIQGASLIQPHGELDCAFFPDNNLDALVSGWIVQAKRKVETNAGIVADLHDQAATQWSYYLAYSYLAGRFAAMPSSVSVNKGADSVSYGQDRISHWQQKAALALANYQENISPLTVKDARKSLAIPILRTW